MVYAFLNKFLPNIQSRTIMLNNIRGGKTRYSAALSNIKMQIGSSIEKWMGLFTPLDSLIGVKAYIGQEVCMTFDVQDDGRLTFTHKETNLFIFCLHTEVRVIANDGSNWVLNTDPQKVNSFWRIWIMERRPISRLTWDPQELYWKVWVQDKIKHVPFFQHSVKRGRKILGGRSWKEPIANVFWR